MYAKMIVVSYFHIRFLVLAWCFQALSISCGKFTDEVSLPELGDVYNYMGRSDKYNRELFTKISQKSKYIDEEIVERVYNGLLKVLATELKEGNDVFLPNLGKFWLRLGQDNRNRMVWVLKFKCTLKLRQYLQNNRAKVDVEDEKVNDSGITID